MTESGLNEFDTLSASNTTETLAPQPVQKLNDPAHPGSEVVIDDQPPHKSITVGELKQREQSELDKVEAAALNVVHSIEEKMELVQDVAIEGIQVAKAVNPINVHIAAGGGSIVKNPA